MASLPHIHLLCMEPSFIDAFNQARHEHSLPPSVPITLHEGSLASLPASVRLDAIVSPANSYGRLDGGFDDALSRALSPRADYLALTRAAQHLLYDRWRGFAPPGSCTLLRVPDAPEFAPPSSRNVWGARFVALCPTMRLPSDVRWDREVVYEAVWSLLCAVDGHNRAAQGEGAAGEADAIRSVLMTPLATGVGFVSAERWAGQLVLALKHFVDALERPQRWSALGFLDAIEDTDPVKKTWEDDV